MSKSVDFCPKINLYSMTSRKEREFIEGKESGFLDKLLDLYRPQFHQRRNIVVITVSNDIPFRDAAPTLFAKIKQFCKDNSCAEEEKEWLDLNKKTSEHEKQDNPYHVDIYTLTRTQAERFLEDRREHLKAEQKQKISK